MTDILENVQQNPALSNANGIAAPAERMLSQSEHQSIMNDVAGKVRSEAYQRGLRDGSSSASGAQAPVQPQQNPQLMQPQSNGITPDEKAKIIQEAQMHFHIQQVATEFNSKLAAGRGKYQDFDPVVDDLRKNLTPNDYANLVLAANVTDNAADVMYNIAKNPEKLAKIVPLTYMSPHYANIAMMELSNSLKQNENALKQKQAREPLAQVDHSNIGIDDGDMSKYSVEDFMKMYR